MAAKPVPYIGDIEVYETPACGRGVRCMEDIPKGTTILREECVVGTLNWDKFRDYCDYCMKRPNAMEISIGKPGSSPPVSRCSRCKVTHYCNRKCQANAWKLYHKKECEPLQKFADNVPIAVEARAVHLVARLIIQLGRNLVDDPSFDDDKFPMTVQQLCCDLSESIDLFPHRVTTLAKAVTEFLSSKFLEENALSPELIPKVIAAVDLNLIGITDEWTHSEDSRIGSALFQRTSMLNHHCRANCVESHTGRWVTIRSVRDLKKGDQVCFQYNDRLGTTAERRDVLRELNRFLCRCSLCEDPSSDLVLRCYTCQTKNCKGFLKMKAVDAAKCTVCDRKLHRTDAIWEKIEEEERLMIDIAHIAGILYRRSDKLGYIVRFSQDVNPRLLHPNHYLVVRARAKFAGILTDCQEWEMLLTLLRENLEPTRYQYPPYDEHVFEVLKELSHLTNVMQEAKELYKQMQEMFQVTHGEDHPLHNLAKDQVELLTTLIALERR